MTPWNCASPQIGDAVLGGERIQSMVVDRLAKGAQQVRVRREYRGLLCAP